MSALKTTTIAITTLLTAAVVTAAPQQHRRAQAPARVMSVSATEQSVTLRLDDGRSVDVPANAVVVRDLRQNKSASTSRMRVHSNAENQGGQEETAGGRAIHGRAIEFSEFREMAAASHGLMPALAKIHYGPDGSVRRARIMLFESDAATANFLARGKNAKAERRARQLEKQ